MKSSVSIHLLRFLLTLAMILPVVTLAAQHLQPLTIEEAYRLAEMYYPLSKKRNLIEISETYTTQNALKGYLPQLGFNGQATYQSDVIKIPISVPGMDIPAVNKAQYRFAGELTQTIFDGGQVKNQIKIAGANADVEKEQLSVAIYQLKKRINELFFGILAIDAQLKQTELLQQDIQYGIDKITAAINNGTAIPSNAYTLRAELLKAKQKAIELLSVKKAFEAMFRQFIHAGPDDSLVLIKPAPVLTSGEIHRPELQLFEAQKNGIRIQENFLSSRNLPKLGLFIQGGAGNPNPVNMLSNEFAGYYIGGVRLNWMLSGLYTFKNDKQLLRIRQQSIDAERESFVFNTRLEIQRQSEEINKWQALIAADTSIISLRNSVKNTAMIQLENGLITANDYLQEVNAEDQARQNLITHEIQLLQAQYALKTTTGN